MKYDHLKIEKKWQNHWEQNQTFRATEDPNKEKYYALDMFPYPSGAGLHVGHPLGYTATDIISRKKRLEGKNVLHPMGWDAFGLPAENYAIKTGVHPAVSTAENEANFKRQIQTLGFSYDWERCFSTTDPQYYRWSQWIFLQLYKKGLAYEKAMPMNWCPKCKIVAANEEVENGTHERCGSTVEKRNLKQWMFRITDYAERLLNDLDKPNVVLLHGWEGSGENGWFGATKKKLEAVGINCLAPDMPGHNNPNYEAWQAHFEAKVKPHVSSKTIVLGHSLGSGFMLRYLSENTLNFAELVLVAPTPDDCRVKEIKSFFTSRFNFEKIKQSAENIFVIAGGQDPYISTEKFQKLAHDLDAQLIFDEATNHMSQSEKAGAPLVEKYSDDLIKGLLDWPDKIRSMQANWIGRSEGAEVDFTAKGRDETITVYTTRPDTLFGATYFVLSPEHPLVKDLTTPEQAAEVQKYQQAVAAKSDLERTELNKDKSGVFTGGYVINPVSGKEVPVWVADYVLMSYGSGAIMAVPAHDERDMEFAQKFDLPIKNVVAAPKFKMKDPETEKISRAIHKGLDGHLYHEDDNGYFEKEGVLVNSDFLNGLSVEDAIPTMLDWLESNKKGQRKVNYKLRDWIFTRQRYWGEPIPLVFDQKGNCYPLADNQLPLQLPQTPNYEPSDDGQSPLAKIQDWVNVRGEILPDRTVEITENGSKQFRRETSTMPNWAGSSWYWLRFMDSKNEQEFCSKLKSDYWGPVDLYVGGAEHAVLHLLYARFWHKVFFDLGLVSTREPFKKLVNQGMIAAEDGRKMSKSLGNVVNPDDVVQQYGADTLRCYEMFMGPFEQGKAWNMGSVGGTRKWLERVIRVFEKNTKTEDSSPQLDKATTCLHQTIKQVGENIDNFKFNTAISQLMVLTNELTGLEEVPHDILKPFALILAPFAPHLAEELWEGLGYPQTLTYDAWPTFDPQYLMSDEVTYTIQVNGKLRGNLTVAKTAEKDDVIAQAKTLEKVAKYLSEGEIKKEIFVPEKIVGFVVK